MAAIAHPESLSPPPAEEVLRCEKHGTETHLRCNRCGRPICSKCAVRTPTGYRCDDCVRGQQRVFDTAESRDFVVAIPIGAGLAFLGSLLIPRLGFLTIFIAPAAGALIAEVIRRAIQKRRSDRLFKWVAGFVAAASLFPLLSFVIVYILALLGSQANSGLGFFGFGFLWEVVYAFMVTSTMYYRLSGREFRR